MFKRKEPDMALMYGKAVDNCYVSICESVGADDSPTSFDKEIEVIKKYIAVVMNNIASKPNSEDFALIDKSRGSIDHLDRDEELMLTIGTIHQVIQDSKVVVKSDKDSVRAYIDVISQARMNLIDKSETYIKAYKQNNAFIISQYRALVYSYIYSVGTVVAETVEFDEEDNVIPRKIIKLNPLNVYLSALRDFNASIESGAWKNTIEKINVLNEEYSPLPNNVLYESSMLGAVISAGLRGLQDKILGAKSIRKGYMVAGIVTMLKSIREVMSSVLFTKESLNGVLNGVSNLVAAMKKGKEGMGDVTVFKKFAQKFSGNTDFASMMGKRASEKEDKDMMQDMFNNNSSQNVIDVNSDKITRVLDF